MNEDEKDKENRINIDPETGMVNLDDTNPDEHIQNSESLGMGKLEEKNPNEEYLKKPFEGKLTLDEPIWDTVVRNCLDNVVRSEI